MTSKTQTLQKFRTEIDYSDILLAVFFIEGF